MSLTYEPSTFHARLLERVGRVATALESVLQKSTSSGLEINGLVVIPSRHLAWEMFTPGIWRG